MDQSIFSTRRSRVHLLVEQYSAGNVTEFAKKFGYSRAQIYQFLSENYNEGRSMGERAARELEKRTKMPVGWLDRPIESLDTLIVQGSSPDGHPDGPAVSVGAGIPILGNVTVNEKGEIVDATQLISDMPRQYLPVGFPGRDLFAIRITSHFLLPRIKSLEYVVVERGSKPSPGDDVLVRFVTGEWWVAQFLYARNDELYFGPVNDPKPLFSMPESSIVTLDRIVMIMDEVDDSI